MFLITAPVNAQTHTLIAGWNLEGNDNGAAVNPNTIFGNATATTSVSSSVTTVWVWDKNLGKWDFFAPSMAPTALSTYAASKGYGVLTSIPQGQGFWVNALNAVSINLTASTSTTLQGVFDGTGSNGNTYNLIVLEDGSFWNLYGISSSSGLAVYGIANGTVSASNGTFTESFTDFYYPGNAPVSGYGSGTYTGTTISGSNTESGQTATFNFTTPATSTYNYNTAATISSISGSWSGFLLDGESGTVNIQTSGNFTSTSSSGCSASGTLTPRPSGKNVFNVSLTFGAYPCLLPFQSISGIAVTYPLGNGTSQLIVGMDTPTKSAATAFFAIR